jgi:SAM-dependent methyltransferase
VKPASTSEQFWNATYRDRIVSPPSESDPCATAALSHFGDVRGKRLLDIGCGTGEYSMFFARRGANVTAVDRSGVAIERLRDVCTRERIENVSPVAADAFAIAELGAFDLVFGKWILHHLEPFGEFARVLRRTMVNDGLGFFFENNGMSNALLWARNHLVGRFGIPKVGDDDEFPLTPGEVDMLRPYFDVDVVVVETYFVRLGARYLLRGGLMGAATRVDETVHRRVPSFRKYSYRQNLLLRAKDPAGLTSRSPLASSPLRSDP